MGTIKETFVKKLAWALVVFAFALSARADEFMRSGKFESVEAFVEAVKSFEPEKTKGDMAAHFTVKEQGQREDPKTGTPIPAKAIESCETLWADDSSALVFALAKPPTEATRSFVGMLFLLKHISSRWQIADSLRFTAAGKEAEIKAQLTAGTGSGYSLGSEGMRPVVTITEWQGGRGYSYGLSASYTLAASKLKRLDLE